MRHLCAKYVFPKFVEHFWLFTVLCGFKIISHLKSDNTKDINIDLEFDFPKSKDGYNAFPLIDSLTIFLKIQ
jgi:hypothetical protein